MRNRHDIAILENLVSRYGKRTLMNGLLERERFVDDSADRLGSGQFAAATENVINARVNGITFHSMGHYYEGTNRLIAHRLKKCDPDCMEFAAERMARLLPENAVLVPMPGHHGTAEKMLVLCRLIADMTGLPVVDALRGNDRESQYEAKYRGYSLTDDDFGFRQVRKIPSGRVPYLVDDVIDTGATAMAAARALGCRHVLSYAMSDALI